MSWRTTEATAGSVRQVADQPRMIEGMAVPYGQVATDTEFGSEAFAPGAFRASVDHWMSRQDGARMAFRPAHGKEPNGVVTELRDTPEGVAFRAEIDEGDDGDKYLRGVAKGRNGISIEAGLPRDSKKMRDGTVLHRSGRLFAIAGSVSPAYDGARIALRDMQETPVTEQRTEPEPTPEPTLAPTEIVSRQAVERDAVLRVRGTDAQITRPELVYGPTSDANFIRDGYDAWRGDSAARERQSRHYAHVTDVSKQIERAGDLLQSEIPGALPTDFLPGLLTPRILKGRPMGGFFNRFPISDTRPRTFAKVTTSGAVIVQAAEGGTVGATDIATTAVTATPLLYGGFIDVSRQVLDSADPSATAMVMQDLLEAYSQTSETAIKVAVEAGATASGTAITAATPYAGVLGNVIKYQTTRFNPAQGQFIPGALYAVLLAQGDTTGRPFLPSIGPVNSDGTARAGATGANVLGADVFLSWASTVNVVVTARENDYVIYESSIAQFSYDQVVGPQAVRIGLWAYLVVGTRLGGLSVTAA